MKQQLKNIIIPVKMTENMVKKIDKLVSSEGFETRSSLIRYSIKEFIDNKNRRGEK